MRPPVDLLRPFRGRLSDRPSESVLRVIPLAGYLSLIWWVSSIPGQNLPSPVNDKLAHMAEYAVLGILLMLALTGARTPNMLRAALVTVLLAAVWGASDEVHQRFVPRRDSSVMDLLADVAGASAAAGTIAYLVSRKEPS